MVGTATRSDRAVPAINGRTAQTITTPRPPGRRIRVPELAVGVLVTVMFSLGAVLWHLNSVTKVPALVTADRIERGAVITDKDIRTIYLSTDRALEHFDDSHVSDVVGRIASVDLAAGSLLTPSVIADATTINDGDGVVGLSLEPGAYPARGIAAGDRVNVVQTLEAADLSADPVVVAREAIVFRIDELPSDRLLVSILTSQTNAESVAAASGAGGLRLVLVSP